MHVLFEIMIAIGGIVGFSVLSIILGLTIAALIAYSASRPSTLDVAA